MDRFPFFERDQSVCAPVFDGPTPSTRAATSGPPFQPSNCLRTLPLFLRKTYGNHPGLSELYCWWNNLSIYIYIYIYTIKIETIENNSHPKWTTLTPHRWLHTAGPKMVDRWKQLFLKYFHSKPPTFLTIALLCTHRTHLLISYGKPIS